MDYAPITTRGPSQFLAGLKIQGRVLGALIMREMLIRYGRENIGFLWLALEPMILTSGVMLMWTLLRHEAHGLVVAAFVLSGYMPLTLWRHISGHAVSCLRQNMPLMYHRQIRLADRRSLPAWSKVEERTMEALEARQPVRHGLKRDGTAAGDGKFGYDPAANRQQ
ncbi:hypothetical protein [Rhizobium sp. RCAM05973]|uniref:ABC transporter permease n=1 Tax=Rhizobium sp. RCAM05973 TaxID=2994066 RepID=UPI0022EBF4D3|nr:hypothetical protein [Rhizobium sp. RCAM05973]